MKYFTKSFLYNRQGSKSLNDLLYRLNYILRRLNVSTTYCYAHSVRATSYFPSNYQNRN